MCKPATFYALAVVVCFATAALGQVDLERFQRQLEQMRRDTQLIVDQSIPVEQRALIDYGGYVSFSFYAIDDTGQNTHILRQTDAVGYARMNFDGVHQFYLRGRTKYQDFNAGDSFDGNGDDWVEPTLDRGIYTFNYNIPV